MALNQTQGRALGGEPFDGEILGTHIAKTIRGYIDLKVGALENRVSTSEADSQEAMWYPGLWSHDKIYQTGTVVIHGGSLWLYLSYSVTALDAHYAAKLTPMVRAACCVR